MIDITQLSPEEIEKLYAQIQTYKSQRNLRGYKVTFYVRFDPTGHLYDMLTSDGVLDIGLFNDYITDNVLAMIESDFGLDGSYETTGCVSVEKLGHEEIQKVFGASIL